MTFGLFWTNLQFFKSNLAWVFVAFGSSGEFLLFLQNLAIEKWNLWGAKFDSVPLLASRVYPWGSFHKRDFIFAREYIFPI